MRNKKIVALLLVIALTLVAVGCANTSPTPQPLASPSDQNRPQDEDEYYEDEYYQYNDDYPSEQYSEHEFADENVKIAISFDRPQYTHSDIVHMRTTITNIGEEIVVFTKGSGSNLVPDALKVELGQLTPLFRPAVTTMDLQTSVLEPGESVTFELPFAPYMYANTDSEFPPMIGLDRDIEFFQGNDEWKRVEAGETEGSIHFSYATRNADDEFFIIVEGEEIFELEDNFTVFLTMTSGTPAAGQAENGAEEPNQYEVLHDENGSEMADYAEEE